MMCNAATDAPKPDTSLCFWAPFHQPLCGGALVGINFEVLGLDINSDVLAVVFVFNLRTDDSLEHLLTAFGELRCFFGHGAVEDFGKLNSLFIYADGFVSFPTVFSTRLESITVTNPS